jgi:CPA2 family monovalent cation:H+ antiporter-2
LLKFDIAVGAFIGGLAISIFPYNLEISNNISGIRSLLSMIFFVSLGMQLTFHFESGYLLLVILFIMVFVLKPLIHFVILIFSGYGTRISVTSSLYLAQVSEFSLILAMQGLLLNHLTSDQYSAIVIVTSVSMLLTPYITEYHDSLYRFVKPLLHHFKKKKYYSRKIDKLNNIPDKIENHLILVGSDVVGDAILKVLSRDKHIPIIIVDQNPEKIATLVAKKINCVCGDVTNEEIIHSINIDKARLIVSTIPRFDVTMRLLTKVKSINPKLKFYARANTNEQALKLYEMGADLVILPKVLESNFLLEKISIFNDEEDKAVDNASFIKGAYVSYLKREVEQEKRKKK